MNAPGRLRSIATAVAIAAALLGTLATTPARASIGNSTTGEPLLLSPENPEATVGFVFEANEAAFDEWSSIGVHFDYEPFWSDGRGSVHALPFDVVKLSGPSTTAWQFSESLGCGGTPLCVGRYEVTFRWPAALDEGSVRVDWSVSAEVSYDRAEPPAGAEASVTLGEPRRSSPAPVRVFETTFPLGRSAPIVGQNVRVTLGAPLADESALAIELDPPDVPSVAPGVLVVLMEEGRAPHRLSPSTSTPLDVPERCTFRPCSFSFSLATNLRPSNNDHTGFVTWGLTLPQPNMDLEVTVDGAQPPAILDFVSLGSVRVVGESRGDPTTVSVRISKAALPVEGIGDSAPVIQARLRLNASTGDLVFPEEGRLDVEIDFPSSPEGPKAFTFRPSWYEGSTLNTEPVAFIVPNGCAAETACKVTLVLTFTTANDGSFFEGGLVALRPTLEVFLLYPLADDVPSGAHLDLALEGGI